MSFVSGLLYPSASLFKQLVLVGYYKVSCVDAGNHQFSITKQNNKGNKFGFVEFEC